MRYICLVLNSILNGLKLLFEDDLDVMTSEARRILSNKEDAAIYKSALERIKNEKLSEITIKLSYGHLTLLG